jgi:hypothetical protein
MSGSDPIAQVRRINRTWIVRGTLAENAARYLDDLEARDPETLRTVCEFALISAKKASHEQRDPKPDFYASIFSRATAEDREHYLRDHAWTRQRSAELADDQ